jgi:hypothetical protein
MKKYSIATASSITEISSADLTAVTGGASQLANSGPEKEGTWYPYQAPPQKNGFFTTGLGHMAEVAFGTAESAVLGRVGELMGAL